MGGSFAVSKVMKLEELPLLDIFNSLRSRYGLPLGVDDYLVVLRSLQAGVGIATREELAQLCCLLWAKSEAENSLILRLFTQMWQYVAVERENEGDRPSDFAQLPPSPAPNSDNLSDETPTSSLPLADEPLPELETPPSLTPEPVQAVQAVRNRQQDRELKRPRYSLMTEYFPVTLRQMKQCWRSLRRPVREGLPIELNVEATVVKIGREGILLAPVLMPPRTNRTDLVLMIDQEGSMVPFHALSRQLLDTAQRGGRLRETSVFYFHDYADEYLYRHPALLDAQPISEVLAAMGKQATILIISDGGAARGNFDEERVKSTQKWIEQLQQSVRYCAWLNPMPKECWQQTTAGEIARLLPMFEMSREGMSGAISILRGRYFVGEMM